MGVERYYRVLFRVPGEPAAAAAYSVLLAAEMLVLGPLHPLPLYTLFSTLLDAVYLAWRGSPLARPRRLLFLHIIVSLYALILCPVMGAAAALAASSSILYITVNAMARYTVLYYLFPALAASMAMLPYGVPGILAAYYLVVSGVDAAIYVWMESRGIRGVGIAEIARLYLENWLERRRGLEAFFEDMSSPAEVDVYIFDTPGAVIVHPGIHYGPFSNVGSSMFPEMLRRRLGKPVLALHGAGSHNLNLPSHRYAEALADEIKRVLEKGAGTRIYPGKAFRVNGPGGWSALVVPFTMASIAILSRPRAGIDDLPVGLQEYVERVGALRGRYPVLIVDAHNWEKKEPINAEHLYALADEIIEALGERGASYTTNYYIGAGVADASGIPGVVGDVAAIVLKTFDETLCLLYIPGNNMEPGLRDKLLDLMRGRGCTCGEVVTNDEHAETGTRPGRAYTPVLDTPELAEAVDAALRKAFEGLGDGRIVLSKISVDVRIMKGYAWRLLGVLKIYFRKTAALLIMYAASAPLIVAALEAVSRIAG